MKKRMLALLLTIVMLLTLLSVSALADNTSVAASGTCGDNLTWVLDHDGTLTISGTGDIDLPGFWDRDAVKAVVIEQGVTSIAGDAFYGCSNLTSVVIPDGFTEIGMFAFEECTSLVSINIPDGVTYIGAAAFHNCSSLPSVTIPDSVTEIGETAFMNCTSLNILSIPDSNITLGPGAFLGCDSLADSNGFVIVNHVLYDYCGSADEVVVPDGVTKIDQTAFGVHIGNDSSCLMTSISVPEGVVSIESTAFAQCPNLEKVYFPASLTTIGDMAFVMDESLTDVYYAGTESQWNEIETGNCNDELLDAVKHFNYHKPAPVSPDRQVSFEDVQNSDDYFYEPVLWAAANGIVYGVDDTHFAPDATCTRAQVVTFLYRAAGEPAVTGSNPFRDVGSGEYYYDAVLWGFQNGIVYGTSDTTFSPNATVTRAQFITFLYRFAQEPEVTDRTSPFADLPADEYYTDAVLWGYHNSIVYGVDDNHFAPNATCTRAQVVTFLHRYMTE